MGESSNSNTESKPSDADALEALRTLRAWFTISVTSEPCFVLTRDEGLTAKTGHTRRVLEDAVRAHHLRGTKVTHGFRIELDDLREWERSRTSRRRPQKAAPMPANDAVLDREMLAASGGARRAR